MARSYEQHCALAHALDVVGERWTLLIVRELLAGPRRYTDLAEGLVTVPTNLLADRLKQMEADDLVRRRRLPAPASSVVVYELTELGEGLAESLQALARWGSRTLPPAREDRSFRAHWLVLVLEARFDPAATAGVSESYELTIDSETIHFAVDHGAGSAHVGPADDPAVSITADADTFLGLVAETITPEQALRQGASIQGDRGAIDRMRAILPVATSSEASRTAA